MSAVSPTNSIPTMTCMEVWGGNAAAETSFGTLGIEIWIHSIPYQQADSGGDIHYVSTCSSGRITRLLVADVSGHGVKVSDLAVKLRGLMRQHINKIDQRRFVEKMNEDFASLRNMGGFATAMATTYHSPSAEFTFTNAGHPYVLYYHHRTRAWKIINPSESRSKPENSEPISDLPLGVLEQMNYREVTLRAEAGDLALIYTDSLFESKRPDGSMLGIDGLRELVSTCDASRPNSLIGELLGKIRQLAPGNLTDDDTTVVLMRSLGNKSRPGLLTIFAAPFRLLWKTAEAIVRREPLPLPDLTAQPKKSRQNLARTDAKNAGV
jgi:sigma-B regulation protein RsbU (phosphoserine phosphatase)